MVDHEVCQLLDPITPQLFLERYWECEPLYIRGRSEKFRGLFSRAAFDRAVTKYQAQGISIRVSFDRENGPKGTGMHIPIHADQIDHYLAQGASICVDPIDRADPTLAAYATAISRQLNHAGSVSVKAYLSSHGHGFNTHFDRQIATTLQIEGKKRWRFSPQPSIPFPLYNGLLGSDGTVHYVGRQSASLEPWEHIHQVDEAAFMEVILEPGDVLCLPAGTWHNAKAIGYSLALNMSFAPLNFLEFLYNMLHPILSSKPEWRRNLPALLGPPKSGKTLPSELSHFFGERLEEIKALLTQLDPVGAAFVDAWKQSVVVTTDPQTDRPAFVMLDDLPRRQSRPADPPHAAIQTVEPRAAVPDGGDMNITKSTSSRYGYNGTLTCAVCVSHLDTAVAWYQTALGFTLRYRVDAFSWCEMATGIEGVTIGLSAAQKNTGPGGTTLILGVTDLDATRHRLEAMGVQFEGDTQVIQGVVKLAPFYDPDGNRLMLSQTLK